MSRRKRTFAERRRMWTPEHRQRYRALMAYLHSPLYVEHLWSALRGMKTLSRVGVTFSPEQQAQVKSLFEADRTADAQRVILDQLKEESGD